MRVATVTPNNSRFPNVLIIRGSKRVAGGCLCNLRGISNNPRAYDGVELEFNLECKKPTLYIRMGGVSTPMSIDKGLIISIAGEKYRVELA